MAKIDPNVLEAMKETAKRANVKLSLTPRSEDDGWQKVLVAQFLIAHGSEVKVKNFKQSVYVKNKRSLFGRRKKQSRKKR